MVGVGSEQDEGTKANRTAGNMHGLSAITPQDRVVFEPNKLLEYLTETVAGETLEAEKRMTGWQLRWFRTRRYLRFAWRRKILGPGNEVYLFVFVLVALIVFFVLFCVIVLRQLLAHEHPAGIVGAVVVPLSFASSLVFYLLTALTDPGYVPSNNFTPIPMLDANDISSLAALRPTSPPGPPPQPPSMFIPTYVTRNGYDVLLKYCYTCNVWRPPRASHCGTCGRCVQRHDHHCPWVRNCIGLRNTHYFVYFLGSMTLLGTCMISLAIVDRTLGNGRPFKHVPLYRKILDVIIIVIPGVFTLMVSAMFVVHLYLVAINTTTHENLKWRSGMASREQLIQRLADARRRAELVERRNKNMEEEQRPGLWQRILDKLPKRIYTLEDLYNHIKKRERSGTRTQDSVVEVPEETEAVNDGDREVTDAQAMDEVMLNQLTNFGENGWRIHRDANDHVEYYFETYNRRKEAGVVGRFCMEDNKPDVPTNWRMRLPNLVMIKSSRFGLSQKYGPFDKGVFQNFREVFLTKIPPSYET